MPSCCAPIMYPTHSRISGQCCTRPALDPADPEQLLLTPSFSYNMFFPSFGSSCIRLLVGSIVWVPVAPHCPAHTASVGYSRVQGQVVS